MQIITPQERKEILLRKEENKIERLERRINQALLQSKGYCSVPFKERLSNDTKVLIHQQVEQLGYRANLQIDATSLEITHLVFHL